MRKTKAQKRREKRERLYASQDGECYWCGCEMILGPFEPKTGKRPPANLATFEHLDDKFSSERGQYTGEARVVLACNKCNFETGLVSQMKQPKHVLHERSSPPVNAIAVMALLFEKACRLIDKIEACNDPDKVPQLGREAIRRAPA